MIACEFSTKERILMDRCQSFCLAEKCSGVAKMERSCTVSISLHDFEKDEKSQLGVKKRSSFCLTTFPYSVFRVLALTYSSTMRSIFGALKKVIRKLRSLFGH